MSDINIEAIKQYNTQLKGYREQAAKLNAEIEYTNKEIDELCTELTQELGIQVTRDNIEQIYNEQVQQINSTLQSGTAVLNKIASESNQETISVQQVQQQAAVQQVQQVQPITPVQSVQQVVQTVQPVQQQTVASTGAAINAQQLSVFGQATPINMQAEEPVQQLPPIAPQQFGMNGIPSLLKI